MPQAARPKVRKRCNTCGKIGKHYTRRNGKLQRPCVECIKAKSAEWQRQNREKRREHCRRYDQSDKGKAAAAAYRETNAEQLNAAKREWAANNPETRRAAQQRYEQSEKGKTARARRRLGPGRDAILSSEHQRDNSDFTRWNNTADRLSDGREQPGEIDLLSAVEHLGELADPG